MNFHNHHSNPKGFTLLEIMFGLGILVVGIYLIVNGVSTMEDINKETKNLSTTERQINVIVDSIRTGLASYQISYDNTQAARESALDLNKLPMAWDPGIVIAVKDCDPKCPGGRYGFTVQPSLTAEGLYIVTLRMKHKDWKEPYKEFQFLVTVQ